ncbi:MAG: SRPBCC family protein [Chloroflexota bacterium]
MKRKRIFGDLVFLAVAAGIVGISSLAAIELIGNPSTLEDSILIERPPQDIFRVLVDPANIDKISQNIGNVQLEAQALLAKDSHYKRILYSHGIPNPQVVTVVEFEQNKLLATATTLVGFDVTYRYVLAPTSDGKTTLSLTKAGEGGWGVFQPLLIHLLTRPEHDGGHLNLIKKTAESQP